MIEPSGSEDIYNFYGYTWFGINQNSDYLVTKDKISDCKIRKDTTRIN